MDIVCFIWIIILAYTFPMLFGVYLLVCVVLYIGIYIAYWSEVDMVIDLWFVRWRKVAGSKKFVMVK